MAKIKLIYIAGAWRSGSTLFGDVLGSIPGFSHVGELHHVWGRGLTQNWLCGCGSPFRQCPFWSQVTAFDDWESREKSAAELERQRRAMWSDLRSREDAQRVAAKYPEYVARTRRLVERAIAVDRSRFLVDSSKTFRQALVHAMAGGIELYVVHLLRDARATVYSMTQRVKDRADDPSGSKMLRRDPDQAIRLWVVANRGAESLGAENPANYVRVRYEDFSADPRYQLSRILELVGVDPALAGSPMTGPHGINLATTHTISGNPGRMRNNNRIEIREDTEWKTALDPALAATVTERTIELLERYGYEA